MRNNHSFILIILFFIIYHALSVNFFTENVKQVEYDKSQSQQFQKYCILTHCNKQVLQNWSCKLCPTITKLQNRLYISNNVTNIVALLAYHPPLNAVIMIFRGTQDIKNWLEDFSYHQISYLRCKNCKVHEGFYTSYMSISLKIQAYIENIRTKYSNFKIYSLGSSLGGAIATIAALQAQVIYGNVAELHVFGCPRVGDNNFAQYLTTKIKSIRRVIHNKDLVPHVPLVSQNYHHAAYEIWFNADMTKYQICNQSGEDSSCSNSLYPNYSIQDHITYWQKPTISQIC